jgi:transcriptional regulator with XRE-family HTH domain
VNEVGKRLKHARALTSLSLRKFAKRFGEDFTLLARIERGKRFPPKDSIEKFARLLSLTPDQLKALTAVERRKLDPNQMLPEIAPAPVRLADIEAQAEEVLNRFKSRLGKNYVFDGPIPIEEIVETTVGLHIANLNFEKDSAFGPRYAGLYGCFYPESFRGNTRVVIINAGKIRGRKLSRAERRITIAHEASHYFLHYGPSESKQLLFQFSKQPTYCREAEIHPGEFNLKEYQANVFGACLLMPRNQFKREWLKVSGDESWLAADTVVARTCRLLSLTLRPLTSASRSRPVRATST